MSGKPVCTVQDITAMFWLCRDAGETHQRFKLLDELAAILG
jgi:hypothetical protein